MNIKELRQSKQLTQKQCAEYLNIPLRTYVRYENNPDLSKSIKYFYIIDKLMQYGYIDETHGILTVSDIKNACEKVLTSYSIDFCYLFGSYAKQKATESSDVDLLIGTSVTGLQFYEIVENLRTELKKKVDVLNINQLENNSQLTNEILKEGIKIYG